LRGLLLRPALTRRRGRTASDAPSVAPAPLSVRLLPSTGRRPVCTPAAVASYRPAHRARGNDLLKKALLYLVLAMLALVLTVAAAAYLVVTLARARSRDEWATQIQAGPLAIDIGVPTALRLVTSSWFAPWLDGRTL